MSNSATPRTNWHGRPIKPDGAQPASPLPRKPSLQKNDIASRRNRWHNRAFRFVRTVFPWAVVGGIATWAYLDADVLNFVLIALEFAGRILFALAFAIIQFVAIFWFMARSKTEVILPGDPKSLTLFDYKGQKQLVKMVKEWIQLLSDRTEFQRMGGNYINGLLLYGPPGTGKCVTGDTRIITPWGYHRIDEIHPARTPDSYWPLNVPVGTVDGVKTASHFYVGGKTETLRIRTYHGYELEGTPEHPVLCLRSGGKLEWVPLSQLTTDDFVGIARNVEVWGSANIEEAYILGLLVGDGHIVSGRRVELSTSDPDIAEKFKAWASGNGWVAHKAPAKYDWYVSAAEAVRRVNQMGLKAVLAPDKTVPEIVWKADRESAREFLRGLFDADGHADKDTGYIELSLSSHQLVKNVQLLLLKFGIMSRVTRRTVFHRYKGVRKQGTAWKLTMAGQHAALFYSQIGFGLARKQEKRGRLSASPNPNDDTIPNIGPLLTSWQPRYAREERRPTYDMLARAVAEAQLQHPTLQWLLEKRPIWSRVEAITSGEASVFDITVPDGHAFVANGFISHNTMLAKCMAGEAGIAFMSIEGSSFRAMFWGVDVLKMIAFCNKAKKLAREFGACIAYIDEIDAVGASRGGVMGGGMMAGMGGGSGSLTRLLYEIDGIGEQTRMEKLTARLYQLFGKKPPVRNWHVLYMGSTNRPDVLDPALTRPGRFDRSIEVAAPDKTGRREIVSYYVSKIAHDETVDIEAIVSDTNGATPARIMSAITKDAVRIALFAGHRAVTQRDIDLAFQEQYFGLENPIEEMEEDQRRVLAYHEAGHAVVAHYVIPDRRIVRVSIIRRGEAYGYVLPVETKEWHIIPLRRYIANIMVSFAGRCSEKVFFGEYFNSVGGDFASIRRNMQILINTGMFGPPLAGNAPSLLGMNNDKTDRNPQAEKYWQLLESQVEKILRDHAAEVHALAGALLERNDLNGQEAIEIMENARAEAIARGEQVPAPMPEMVMSLLPEHQNAPAVLGELEPAPVAE